MGDASREGAEASEPIELAQVLLNSGRGRQILQEQQDCHTPFALSYGDGLQLKRKVADSRHRQFD